MELDGDPDKELGPDYNVAPTKNVYAVLSRVPKEAERAVRQLRVVKWGLVPAWAKDPSVGSRMINAQDRDGGGEALLPSGVRQAAVPAPG